MHICINVHNISMCVHKYIYYIYIFIYIFISIGSQSIGSQSIGSQTIGPQSIGTRWTRPEPFGQRQLIKPNIWNEKTQQTQGLSVKANFGYKTISETWKRNRRKAFISVWLQNHIWNMKTQQTQGLSVKANWNMKTQQTPFGQSQFFMISETWKRNKHLSDSQCFMLLVTIPDLKHENATRNVFADGTSSTVHAALKC